VIGAVVRIATAACPDDDQDSLERARPTALVAVNGLAAASTPPPPADCPTRSPARPEDRFAGDPSLVAPVIASAEEVFRARALREQIKKQYFDRPEQPCLPWSVGID
jgi:hypothetical protein